MDKKVKNEETIRMEKIFSIQKEEELNVEDKKKENAVDLIQNISNTCKIRI